MANTKRSSKKPGENAAHIDATVEFRNALVATKNSLCEYTPQEIVDMFKKVDTDEPTAKELAAFRELLAKHRELWQVSGDTAALAVKNMLRLLQAQRSMKESIQIAIEVMRQDMGYEHASMLEKLLIEHVTVCWLRMYLVDYRYTNIMDGSVTLAQGAYWERRLTMVQDRYLRAMETLARVRRLMKPVPVQVNIGAQQINRVGP